MDRLCQSAEFLVAKKPFAGQVVMITGAGQGIGRSIACAFGVAGARVVLAARSEDRLAAVATEIQDRGGQARAVVTDVRDAGDVDQLRDAVLEQEGRIDVVVANAGIPGPTAPLWEQPISEWQRTLDVNLTGVFLCCRAFMPAMVSQGSGSVVVIGSMTGKRPLYGRSPYAASKMGLIGLIRTLAMEAGGAGVRVNLISPGPVAGSRLEGVIAKQAETKGISLEEARAELVRDSPLRRPVDASDIAEAALFLASDRASNITGEDLNVSAGTVTYG